MSQRTWLSRWRRKACTYHRDSPAPNRTHGFDEDHGFVPTPAVAIAREKGAAAYVGEGLNHWPAVHRLDAAQLYRLVLEKGSAGARYHGVAEEGIPFREIATVIGRRLNLPVVSTTPEEGAEYFGWFAHFSQPSTTWLRARRHETRRDGNPTHPGLIADLDHPRYFEN